MNTLSKLFSASLFAAAALLAAPASSFAQAPAAAAEKKKNWTPPAHKIYAQTLSEQVMAAHPELLSLTFHGVPPGQKEVYTMFAGSFPDRLGNADDPDDVDVIVKGITIVDPRWHRANDPVKKFVMMMPLRDASNENVGLLVAAYKLDANPGKGEKEFFLAGTELRDSLRKQIPSYAKLFEAAK
ncbi:MAG: hypothetical protein J0I77_10600 [Rudaea sp.]|uniref:hypothetical protein n=1 Tax=unclassified Rudaea TaxID=2627037 RepID=UPI001AC3291B|nr:MULTISPECIES: hypothetical protein [unclassified Rudaea]MBN8886161.1 hypothetical protein [Rudaea sp.]MBR0347116.1 hypothetical protein [Rudaea sp.]